MGKPMIECNHNHPDCFGNFSGECQVLCEQITGKECPFYKTRIERQLEIPHVKENERLIDVLERME